MYLLSVVACWYLSGAYGQSNSSPSFTLGEATSSSSSSSSLASGAAPPTSSVAATATKNATSFATTMAISVEDLWDLFVGPVEVFSINTTVMPTPVPSSELVPPPPLYYPAFPTGAQVPMMTTNSSWSFPSDFWWGVASAAYQSEGAVKDEGRGPSIWDVLLHRVVGYSSANQTGDIADNHYWMYKQDIARIAALGVPAYSFTISWSRIMPFGRGPVNEQALAHYEDVIDTCIQYGVEPLVTLYHWDLPLYLQNLYGGWLSEEIVPDFVEYARVVFGRYGPKVKKFFTVNEPIVFCGDYPLPDGYFAATAIPAKQQPYFCGQSVLLAHSQAYQLGKSMGIESISFKTNGGYKIPLTNSSADLEATQRAWDFNEGWFANPIFINGSYPRYLSAYVSSFLRPLNSTETAIIVNSSDIFAHDAYTSQFYMAPDTGIAACTSNTSHPLYPSCFNSTYSYPKSGWNIGYAADPGSPWLHKATDWVVPFLTYIQTTWNPSGGIAVSEFGFAEPYEALKLLPGDIRFDLARTAYYHDYMRAILQAMSEGVKVVGCLAWSIMDNLEWAQGYTVKFGLQYVNLTTQERVFKSSFFEYVDAFKVYGGVVLGNGTMKGNGTGNGTTTTTVA